VKQFVSNITPLQWLGIIVLFNGMIIGGTSQMDILFGATITKSLVAIASLGNVFLGGLVTMFGGQSTQVKNVLAMPGIESIKVNAQANHDLAQIAVDPTLIKIDTIPGATAQVTATAKGAA